MEEKYVKYGKMVDYLMSRVYEQYDEYMGTHKPMPYIAGVSNLIDALYLVFKGKNE